MRIEDYGDIGKPNHKLCFKWLYDFGVSVGDFW